MTPVIILGFLFIIGILMGTAAVVIATIFGDKYARRITSVAVLIAGRKRLSLREEWRGHLTGDEGHELSSPEKLRAAFGFAVAAVRYRFYDASLLAWRLIDAILKSRSLSNIVVLGPPSVAAAIILHHDGAVGMLGSAGSIAAIGGTLYGLVRVGRWWRDVKPPEPKARRAKELCPSACASAGNMLTLVTRKDHA